MHVLVIYAHPDRQSFNQAIYQEVVKGLKDGGQLFDTIDLYEEAFNPVLQFSQAKKKATLDSEDSDPKMARYRQMIDSADHLIFIYPIWWYGMPAILKGFIDRVFISGYAYKYVHNIPKGLLRGKSATLIYTMDSPAFYTRLFRQSIEWRSVKRPIFYFCGIRPVKRLMFPGVRTSSEKTRKKWLRKIYLLTLRMK
ncbi:NAD(P)H-dependent oxidoreductase [Sporolactobacillus pectinivorans]|uniref:NAD(P)H-dependent oxidoreductase n=1 Tax=Sporolactobacillus pectinivorans TaxID=1591408 RepID=UPI000C2633A2|nr:NAD(P)H-dependent oxidoreductase [Sporolactobacillus pectinivorans]